MAEIPPPPPTYPARLTVDRQDRLERVTTLFRLFWILPIVTILALISASVDGSVIGDAGEQVRNTGITVSTGLAIATALMIAVRQKYPRWWFDFTLELTRFAARVGAYGALLTDVYPSTTDRQSVHLDVDYPNVEQLDRWMPLVKWFPAIPHYLVLVLLAMGAVLAVIAAWLAILFTGRYPAALFDDVVGVGRWALRVQAYAFLLVTDQYPPFSLR